MCIVFDPLTEPVDTATIATSGTANFGYAPELYLEIGSLQKLYFWFLPSEAGTVSVSFEADTSYTVEADFSIYQDYTPLDTASISYTIEPDCGTGTGAITINADGLNASTVILSAYSLDSMDFVPSSGTSFPDLYAGSYIVTVEDALCGGLAETTLPPLVVPDSSIAMAITTINPILNCTSTNATASGVVSGSVQGTVSGGSGSYVSSIFSTTIEDTHSGTFSLDGLTSSGSILLQTIDTSTLCTVDTLITLPNVNDTINISFNVTNGLCISGTGTWPVFVYENGVVEASENSSTLDFDFAWDDPGSTSGSTLTYSALDVYTVTASIAGESCEVSADFDASTLANVGQGDLNEDEMVNAADLNVFLGVFGTTCSTPSSGCQGDFNADGTINSSDLALFYLFLGTQVDCGS